MPAQRPGRPCTLDRQKKTQICDLVSAGAKLADAALAVGVSVRTIQRQILRDPEFDQELRLCQATPADPLRLMQSAARTHWRAAAWLLERENPELYGRRAASACSPAKFQAALNTVLEAALEATPPELQAELYDHVRAACEAAFAKVFPTYGPCGRFTQPKLPPTPLVDAARRGWFRHSAANHQGPDFPEAPTPEPRVEISASPAPNRAPAPPTPAPAPASSSPRPADNRLPWHYAGRIARAASPVAPAPGLLDEPILSPKTHPATQVPDDNNHRPAVQDEHRE